MEWFLNGRQELSGSFKEERMSGDRKESVGDQGKSPRTEVQSKRGGGAPQVPE